MDPTTAWTIIIVVGVALTVLTIFLVRNWDKKNRRNRDLNGS